MFRERMGSSREREIITHDKVDFTVLQRIWGHFLLIRPIQLIWLDIFVGLAAFAIVVRDYPSLHFILFILCSFLADAGACTLNDIGDVDSDRISTESSRSKRPMCTGAVGKKAAWIQTIVLYSAGLALALYLDIYVFIFALALVIISVQYSMRPLKMDGRPIVSTLFWVTFAILYFCAACAYFIRYENVPMENIYDALYFLAVMVLFLTIGETLAKDLRDIDNDRDAGKRTTTVFLGVKRSAIGSFIFSTVGLSLWVFPHFFIYNTPLFLQIMIAGVWLMWTGTSLFLCISLFKGYSKERARELHLGFLLTLTCVLALTFFSGVS